MHYVVLALKRLMVLIPGLALAWASAFVLFPWFHHRLPLAVAWLATYCLVAYFVLPALARVWHTVDRPTHVPTRSLERDGWAADPINLVVVARDEQAFRIAMLEAGWLIADPATIRNSVRAIFAIITNRPYPTAPFEANFVFGKPQDLGFQIPIGNSPLRRHHVRFWQLHTVSLRDEHEHHGFWRNLLAPFRRKQHLQIWIGAATRDRGIHARRRNLQFGHVVESDTSIERDFLVKTLHSAGVLVESLGIKAGEPLHTSHQHFREMIVTDGYVTMCELKDV